MIEVLWTPAEIEAANVLDRPGVLIDVLRASTTMTTAIHNGARAIVPVESTEEAMRIANSLGRDDVLLCGERGGVRIEGFDLGNSPAEFGPEVVAERTIVMTTTNGTRTLKQMAGAGQVFIGCFNNLSAVASAMIETNGDLLIVCAGWESRVAADDALCAGMLIERWLKKRRRKPSSAELDDGALAALSLARQRGPVSVEFLRETAAGKALEAVGLGDDLERCAQIDSVKEVPVLRDSQVRPLVSPSAARVGETT